MPNHWGVQWRPLFFKSIKLKCLALTELFFWAFSILWTSLITSSSLSAWTFHSLTEANSKWYPSFGANVFNIQRIDLVPHFATLKVVCLCTDLSSLIGNFSSTKGARQQSPYKSSSEIDKNCHKNSLLDPTYMRVEINCRVANLGLFSSFRTLTNFQLPYRRY